MNNIFLISKEKLLASLCIIDILFLTYMPIVSLSFSVPIAFLWMIVSGSKKVSQYKEFKVFLILIVLAFISSIVSIFVIGTGVEFITGIKITIELFLTCCIYFILLEYIDYVDIDKYLRLFIYFGTALAIIYFLDRSIFLSIKHVINATDGDSLSYYMGTKSVNDFRYNFLWTDANNVAYMFTAVLFFLLYRNNYSLSKKVILICCTALIVIATMSKGGMIAFVATLILYIIFSFMGKKEKFKITLHSNDIIAVIIMMIVIALLLPNISSFFSGNETILQSFDRIQNNTSGSNSRIAIWESFLTNKPLYYYLFCGEGPIHFIYSRTLQPHNGFLYLIYGYGAIFGFLFFKYFFIPKKINIIKYFYYFPILMGFFVNTMLTNPKILGLIFIIKICSDKIYSDYPEVNA